jgi:flagellar motor switch protein FliN/FliY
MMAAAAMATTEVLGEEVEIAPPDVRNITDPSQVSEAWDHPGSCTIVTFSFCGAQCLLVQLVPHAFIVKMTRALDELTAEYDASDLHMTAGLMAVEVRVWAELGRARMPSGRVVTLPCGSVVELNREVDAPIDLYADGMRFAAGRLLVTDDGGLAVRIESVIGVDGAQTNTDHTEVMA